MSPNPCFLVLNVQTVSTVSEKEKEGKKQKKNHS